MARKLILSVALVAIALAGCGATETAPNAAPKASATTEVGLSVRNDGTTLLRSGERSQVLPGRYEHARLAPGFPNDGRSLTGSRIVLQDTANDNSDRVSRFAVVDTSLAQPARMVELPGDFGYDAVSPAADTLYLVSHFSVERPDQYVVRSYDVAAGTLDEAIVADKAALREGPMSGQPVARATTTGGEWVYTAYRGDDAFVHALDTVRKTAVCIDLPHAAAKVSDWRLTLDGTALMATSPATGMAVKIHTKRFTAKLLPPNDPR
jgi:hypothetical protein